MIDVKVTFRPVQSAAPVVVTSDINVNEHISSFFSYLFSPDVDIAW